MTLTQLRNATTKMDLDKIKYTKGKKKYIYSVLTTIARQENDNSFEHLYNTKHKLTADTIKMLKEKKQTQFPYITRNETQNTI